MKHFKNNFRLIVGSLAVAALMFALVPVEAAGLGAAPGGVPGASLSSGNTPQGAVIAFAVLLQRFADGAAALAGSVAILFVVINAARMTFSIGDTEAIGKARKGLIWAAAGLVLIIFAYIVTKSVIALTYSGADGSSVIGTAMIEAPGSPSINPVAGGANPNGLCKEVGVLPSPCTNQHVAPAIPEPEPEAAEDAEEAETVAFVPETEDDPEFVACQAEATTALAGVCSDLGVGECNIANLQTAIDYSALNTTTECETATGRYSRCTFRAIQELYRTQCIQ